MVTNRQQTKQAWCSSKEGDMEVEAAAAEVQPKEAAEAGGRLRE